MRHSAQRILRCKGLIDIQDGPWSRYAVVIQGVGEHVEWDTMKEGSDQPDEATGSGDNSPAKREKPKAAQVDSSRLVVIFQNPSGVDTEKLRRGFANCAYTIAKKERDE